VLLAAATLSLLVAGAPRLAEAQVRELEDVVYLQDGSVIRGRIIEQIPGQSLLIRTRDGNVFRFEFTRISRIAAEEPFAVGGNVAAPRQIGRKSPGSALLLSFLLHGGGQFYNGETLKGIVHLGLGVLSAGVAFTGMGACFDTEYTVWDPFSEQYEYRYGEGDCLQYSAGLGAAVLTKLWSMYDAHASANRINRLNGISFQVAPAVRIARERAISGSPDEAAYHVRVGLTGTIRF
jgi:hypothetical protein